MGAEHDPEAVLHELGVNMDDIWAKAAETAGQQMRDKALYGMTFVDSDGKRIPPSNIRITSHHGKIYADFASATAATSLSILDD